MLRPPAYPVGMTDREPTTETPGAPDPARADAPLLSKPSAGQLNGGLLAGLEGIVTGRPKPVAQIEEQYGDNWASADGMTVEGLDEPIDRPEPPDRSGARL